MEDRKRRKEIGIKKFCIMASTVIIALTILNRFGIGVSHGKVIEKNDTAITFQCSKRFGNVKACGGSWTDGYKCVLRDNKAYIFYTLHDTTGDNGMTTEYVKTLNGPAYKAMLYDVNTHAWGRLYNKCDDFAQCADEKSVVSYGMNDTASRNPDGSYKWEDSFNKLAGIN